MFKAKNNHEVFNKILEFDVNFPFNMDKDAIDLIKKLCSLEPEKRLGYNKNFSAIKKHRFFNGVDFESIKNKILVAPGNINSNYCKTPTNKNPVVGVVSFSG